MEAPKKPKVDDFGINEADLNKNSLKDILLSESLSSLIMVLGTVLAIWAVGWWGIGLACLGLAVLYFVRKLLSNVLRTKKDVAKENYQGAMDVYYREVHTHDAYMDELERKSKSSDC